VLQDFINRLKKVARHRGKWARRRGIAAYRVYERDIPGHPFIVDVYGDQAHVQLVAPDGDQPLPDAVEVVEGVASALGLEADRIAVKLRERQKGALQYTRLGRHGEEFVVQEGGHNFLVNLTDHLDTGLFLDHRITRAVVGDACAEKSFLNLYAYTGAFTVYAACRGARASVSVDTSRTYLDWAARNFTINGVDPGHHRLVRQDVRKYLHEAGEEGETFDIILLDPPTFSNSKTTRADFEVERDHGELIRECRPLLAPGGTLYFSTNKRRFRFNEAGIGGLVAVEITDATIPDDFARYRPHRCWRISRSGR
jgi:23S rRNA (cytosine1962-C5)-methyltransferase